MKYQKINKICRYVNEEKEGIIEKDTVLVEKIIDIFNLRNTLQKRAWLKVAGYSGNSNRSFDQAIKLMDVVVVRMYVLLKIYH